MASIADLQAAASDPDLLARFDIAALSQGLPHGWAATNLARLVSVNITDGGQQTSVSDVHAYASNVYEAAIAALPPKPGANPAAVTDTHIYAAIQAVQGGTV